MIKMIQLQSFGKAPSFVLFPIYIYPCFVIIPWKMPTWTIIMVVVWEWLNDLCGGRKEMVEVGFGLRHRLISLCCY